MLPSKMLQLPAKMDSTAAFDLLLLAEFETNSQLSFWAYQVKPDGTEHLDATIRDRKAKPGERGLR